jgi:hypothetical protein
MSAKWPTSAVLTKEVLAVLRTSNGEVASSDIDRIVILNLNIDKDLLNQMRTETRTEISYRLAWVRTKAKQSQLIEKTQNRKWVITEKGRLQI